MMDKENIEDWYKDELSGYEVNPDKGSWESISNQLDNSEGSELITEENIDAWYVKELEKFESIPDKAVWNKLSAKLDVSNVWDKLLVSLNRYERFIWWRNFAFEATAVALLLWGGYYTFNNYSSSNSNTTTVQQTIQETTTISKDKTHLNNKVLNQGAEIKTAVLTNTTPKIESEENKESSKFVVSDVVKKEKQNSNKVNLIASSQKEYIGKVRMLSVSFEDEKNENKTINKEIDRRDLNVKTLEAKEFLVKKENNKIVFNNKRFSSHFVFGMYARRLYFGLNVGAKKQTVITKLKDESYLSDYNRKQLLDFGSSLGVTVGLIVSDKLNIESNINFLSSMGYKYQYKSEGVDLTEELNLNYTTVSVMAKMMNNKSTFDNKKYSTNLLGGFYLGYLNAAKSFVDGVSMNQINNFKKLDAGFVLGVEQDRYLTKELVITPGVRYYQGIINTASSNSQFNASRNFSLEFNLGIKYIFLKKG